MIDCWKSNFATIMHDGDKRKFQGRRVLKRVFLSFGEDHCGVHAVLKNHSETGAFIEFSDAVLIPNEFTMHNELDGYKVDCRVVRRSGNSAGVTYISAKSTAVMVRRQVVGVPNLRTVESTEDIELQKEKEPIAQPVLKPRPVLSPPVRKTVTFGKKGIT